MVDAPILGLLIARTERRVSELPDGEVECKEWGNEGGVDVNEEGEREAKERRREEESKRRGKETRETRGETATSEKTKTSKENNTTRGVDVDDGVLVVKTEETLGNQEEGDMKLVACATGGGEGVGDKTEVVEEKVGGSGTSSEGERGGERSDTNVGRWARKVGLMLSEKG